MSYLIKQKLEFIALLAKTKSKHKIKTIMINLKDIDKKIYNLTN